jgi:sRNA-binding regulator protein Hfq
VLEGLMRKERATQLIESDGLEPGLAGQVASGHLSRERALELQRIRMFRKERIDRDALKLAEIQEVEVGVGCFDGAWFVGKVSAARTYEVDFVLSEGGETRLIQKHDVKIVCPSEVVTSLREVEMFQGPVREVGLAGTADRSERVRPTDARLLQLIEEQLPVTCLLRDGSSYRGVLRSFGRWDMSMEIEGAGEVTVLFHALHKSNTWSL